MPGTRVIDGIPHDWIIDELREAEMVSVWDDAAGYMDAVKSSYRRNNWQDQPQYGEVWSEKATLLGSMRPINQELGVMLRACRGFGSTGMEGQVGYLFAETKKPITVFYLGDHDPSGHCSWLKSLAHVRTGVDSPYLQTPAVGLVPIQRLLWFWRRVPVPDDQHFASRVPHPMPS